MGGGRLRAEVHGLVYRTHELLALHAQAGGGAHTGRLTESAYVGERGGRERGREMSGSQREGDRCGSKRAR